MARYRLENNGSPVTGVFDTQTGDSIPNDINNRHWIRYLKWLTEGSPLNVPDIANDFIEDWDNTGRYVRDKKLADTDWTQLQDAPLDVGSPTKRNEFVAYRQSLRDLPSVYPDYSTVVWPTEPTYP